MDMSLRDLLYYDLSTVKNGEIQKRLKEYELLLNALVCSIEAFEAGDLEKFDSLVGENACQIRAIRLALMHYKTSMNSQLKQSVSEVKKNIEEYIYKKIRSISSSGISLADLFEQHKLNIELSEDEIFALISYILTEMKEVYSSDMIFTGLERKEKCSPVKIKKLEPSVTYSFSSRLASHLRKKLSTLSVQFVQKVARSLQDPLLERSVSDAYLYEHNALQCLPMYPTYKTLLMTLKSENIPIIAHVKFTRKTEHGYIVTREKQLFFLPQKNSKGELVYQQCTPSAQDLKQAACIVQGFASCTHQTWEQDFLLNDSILDTILAGASAHRQYPAPHLIPCIEDEKYEELQQLADQKGFSLNNPRTFFIQHVFASQAQNYLTTV